jgi:hypothetical protein
MCRNRENLETVCPFCDDAKCSTGVAVRAVLEFEKPKKGLAAAMHDNAAAIGVEAAMEKMQPAARHEEEPIPGDKSC